MPESSLLARLNRTADVAIGVAPRLERGDLGTARLLSVGPDAPPAPAPPRSAQDCLDLFDLNADGDIDLLDAARFIKWGFTGD
jgi:DNA-binding transcriptional LysR family regulator